jgi:predicted dehydrogenase
MSKRTLGICVIGTGRAGMIHARNFSRGVSGARLVAVADPLDESRDAAAAELGVTAAYADYQQALHDERVDAVVVVTPTVYHREVVVAAAQAGKHVLCEKPMAMNAGECRDMIEACEAAGVKLQIGFMRRFDASFQDAYERVREGAIGDVCQVKSLTHGPSVPQAWMLDVKKSNGPLAEVSSHDIDTVRWFTGSDIVEVYGYGSNYRCRDRAAEYPDFYDTFALVCRFENGAQGVIDGAVSVGYGYDARTEILGTDGIILVGSVRGTNVTVLERGGTMRGRTVASWRDLFSDAYRTEDEAFVRAVLDDTTPLVTGHDGLQAVQVVNAGNTSIWTGKPVTVGEGGE